MDAPSRSTPVDALKFAVPVSLNNPSEVGLRTKVNKWDVVFVASVVLALVAIGTMLMCSNTTNASVLVHVWK